jgi:hypothetical protein
MRASPIRWLLVGAVSIAAIACATIALTPEGRTVVMLTGDAESSGSATEVTGGCRLVAEHESVDLTELDLANDVPPFVRERNRTATGGANVLLVRKRVIVPRGFECPAASPITDCPPQQGAWLRVSFDDYRCPDGTLRLLQERAPH